MIAAFMPELIQDTILVASLISIGVALLISWRTYRDRRYFIVSFCFGYCLTIGLIAELVYRSPEGTPLNVRSGLYTLGLLMISVGIVGWVFEYRKGLRLGRLDRVIHTDEDAQTVSDQMGVREARQRAERRGLASRQEHIDGELQSVAREDLESTQSEEQEPREEES